MQHYNLYRSYSNANYQQIATIPAIEGQQFYQYRDVLVGETHNYFYYKLTAVYLSDEDEECESDFAASLEYPDRDYVMVDDAWEIPESQVESIDVYPNPNNGQIVVEGSTIRQVSVFNALGKCVISIATEVDELHLDLTDCQSGIYLLRVVTENGTISKRIVLR